MEDNVMQFKHRLHLSRASIIQCIVAIDYAVESGQLPEAETQATLDALVRSLVLSVKLTPDER